MKTIIKLGNMYICRLEINNYDNEVNVNFTSNIEDAKEFNEELANMFIDILVTLFGDVEFSILQVAKENNEEGK